MSRFGGVVAVVALGVALTGGGGGSAGADAPPAESAAYLRDMFQANGLRCRHFEQVPAGERKTGATDQGRCEEGAENLMLLTFATGGRRDAYLDAGEKICPVLAREFGSPGPVSVVLGPNWLVTPQTKATASRIAKAVDADTKTLRC